MGQRLCSVIRTKMNKSQSLPSKLSQPNERDSKSLDTYRAEPGAITEMFSGCHERKGKNDNQLLV